MSGFDYALEVADEVDLWTPRCLTSSALGGCFVPQDIQFQGCPLIISTGGCCRVACIRQSERSKGPGKGASHCVMIAIYEQMSQSNCKRI
mmetsp:Transcript_22671/g.38553  ORF Transcript_22671/g.38553 Transcript_22671/m.38553 type:complete len:90 (+) Transcript_22671:800-1069(+)